MLGPIEIIFVLLVWALPLAVLVWFAWTLNTIRNTLERIERRLNAFDRG